MSGRRNLMIANAFSKWPKDATVWKVETATDNYEYGLRVSQWRSGTYIEWGDGQSSDVSASGLYTHIYQTPGEYTVAVIGPSKQVAVGRTTTGASPDSYAGIVTDVLQISAAINNCNAMFHSTRNKKFRLLQEVRIPEGCDNGANMFWYSSIKELPDGFALPYVNFNCNAMFYACGSLAVWPEAFVIHDKVTNMGQFLWAGRYPGNIEHLLSANSYPLIKNWGGAFGACAGLKGTAPAAKLWEAGIATGTANCFLRCTGLTNYNSIPASWGGGGA